MKMGGVADLEGEGLLDSQVAESSFLKEKI